MKTFILSMAFGFGVLGLAVPKDCFTTVDNTQFCSTDNLGKVQVFIFNAGWCGPCNQEMDEMPDVFDQFKDQPVLFASLSGQNDSGAAPDIEFLKDWKIRHHLPTSPNFVVAGKHNDFGSGFGAQGYVPFTAIIDQKGQIAKSGSMGGSDIADAVRQLLNSN